MNRRKLLYALEVIGALLYAAWLLSLFADEEEWQARILHYTAKACKVVAGRIGWLGLKAEVAYNELMEMGRMN